MLVLCRKYAIEDNVSGAIINDAFLSVFKNIEKFEYKGSFEGWIPNITFNTLADYFRKENKQIKFLTIEDHISYAEVKGDSFFEYDDLMINYKVDEDLTNYLEIHNWVKELGFPDNYNQYKNIADKGQIEGLGLRSDISLIILNSSRLPNMEINFKDAFPVSISSLIFDTTRMDVDYLEAAATFKYTSFEIKRSQ